ncbi:MAG: hypothetical protein WBE79_00125 [Candidatus Cybelea sp.]
MRAAVALILASLMLPAGCAGSSDGPKGWKPVPGASGAWTTGSGETAQQYSYVKTPFGGGLQDLASQVTIDNLMRHRGARFHGSVPFPACPGAAGVASFSLPDQTTVQEGFAVHDGQAVRVRYVRPTGAKADPSATQAMESVLCAVSS